MDKKLLDKVSSFTGYKPEPNDRQIMIDILDDLHVSMENIESEIGEYVIDLKKLKLNLKAIAFDECHGERKLLNQTREKVKWLITARKYFTSLVNILRKQISDRFYYEDQMRKLRDSILKMDDVPFFLVYRDSLWL